MSDQPQGDYIGIALLTNGYVVQFRGSSFAAGSQTQVTKVIREILKQVDKQRREPGIQVPPPPATLVRPTAEQPVVAARGASGASPPLQAPGQAQPMPTPDGTAPVGDPGVLDLEASKRNLHRIATARMMGEITDAQYFQYVTTYCPGISEDEAVDYVDSVFSGPQVSVPGVLVPPPDDAHAPIQSDVPEGERLVAKVVHLKNGKTETHTVLPPKRRPPSRPELSNPMINENIGPAQMVEDYVSDVSGRPIQVDYDDDLPPGWGD